MFVCANSVEILAQNFSLHFRFVNKIKLYIYIKYCSSNSNNKCNNNFQITIIEQIFSKKIFEGESSS